MTATMMFVNLPVKDLSRSRAFFEKLGYSFNPAFSDDSTACLVLGEHVFAMLMTHARFATFVSKPIFDAEKTAGPLLALSAESRAAVDRVVGKALESGGREARKPEDHGWMYGRSFEDPDGHVWEHVWMDPAAAAGGPPPA